MPAVSKQQYKFMKSVEGGYIHPKGLSKEKAKEFTQDVKSNKLPKFASLKKKLMGK